MNQPVVIKSGGAGGVFWGLFLFFVVLPIALIGGCGVLAVGCAMVGGAANSVHDAHERAVEIREAEENETQLSDGLGTD